METNKHAYCVYSFDSDGIHEILQTYPTFLQAQRGAYTWKNKGPNVAINYGRLASVA